MRSTYSDSILIVEINLKIKTESFSFSKFCMFAKKKTDTIARRNKMKLYVCYTVLLKLYTKQIHNDERLDFDFIFQVIVHPTICYNLYIAFMFWLCANTP